MPRSQKACESAAKTYLARRARNAERVLKLLVNSCDELSVAEIVVRSGTLTDFAVRIALASLVAAGRVEGRRVLRPYRHVNVLTSVYRPFGAEIRLDWGEPSDLGDVVREGLGVKDRKEIEARKAAAKAAKVKQDEETFWQRVEQAEWVGPRGKDRSAQWR